MNHLFRVILVLCLPTIAVAAVLTWNNRANPRPAHEAAVEKYVAYRRSTTIPTLTITQYAEASLPQNFRPDMRKTSSGKSTFYRTSQCIVEPTDVDVWPLTVTIPMMTMASTQTCTEWYGGDNSSKPMPYPPTDLWCAQLSSPDPAAPKVVVVGLYQDMYVAIWIVQEVTDPDTVLAAVGCQFSSQ